MVSRVRRSVAGLILLGLTLAVPAPAADPILVDFQMDKDPQLVPQVSEMQFREDWKRLWIRALGHREAEAQIDAAGAIATARLLGMPGLEAAIPELARVLEANESPGVARLAAARTLVILGARDRAELMFKRLSAEGSDFAAIVEPALTQWDFRPIRDAWIARLTDRTARRRMRVLAIRGLSHAREDRAVPGLQAVVEDRLESSDLRLEAATALGLIRNSGLEALATMLLADRSPEGIVGRLAGVRILEQHQGEPAVALLQGVARDDEAAVASAALSRLLAISPDQLIPHLEWGAAHADAGIRQRIETALAERPTPERIQLLSTLLDDPHSANRARVCSSLYRLSGEHREAVLAGAQAMLATDKWRGLEQAALLLGKLDYERASSRLVQLMRFPRLEVNVASAWALREMAVAETLPPLLEIAREETRKRPTRVLDQKADEWEALVFELFGAMKYAPADDLLRQYVPKNYPLGERSRSAAVRALGQLHAGTASKALCQQFLERAKDIESIPPEMEGVRLQSELAIGRIGAKELVPDLKKLAWSRGDIHSLASAWSIEQMTGEKTSLTGVAPHFAGPWFLEPVDQARQAKP